MLPPTAATLWRALASFGLGLAVGALGTVMHRAIRPWGLVLCLLLVLAAVLTARAWVSWYGYVASVGGVVAAVQVLAGPGPGGDLLVPADEAWGWLWVVGSLVTAGLVAAVPRRWVEDEGSAAP